MSISAWNVHGLGDKMNDDMFINKISSDINILLETWTGADPKVNLQDYNSISKCRKKKKRNQGDTVEVSSYYTKKYLSDGITYIKNATSSENMLWLKLDKNIFGLDSDLYIGAIYVPPISSNHYDNDFEILETEIRALSNQGKILLIGDFNSLTGKNPHYILQDY